MNAEPEALPLLSEPRSVQVLVESKEQLQIAAQKLADATGRLAIDAERASGFKYSQRAYLVQLHKVGTPIYLLDPMCFELSELEVVARVINRDEWILHAATQDLTCLAELGFKPASIFDTELISRLLGFERVGLGAVTERTLNLRLAKEHSAADWSTRPLPQNWLNYAALDVDVLPEIAESLEVEIVAQGKTDIVRQEMHHLLGFKPKAPKADRWRTMGGFHELKEQRQLAVAKSVWEAREELAKRLDVSPGRLIPDSSLLHLAKTQHRSRSILAADKAFNGRASRSYLDTWWAALEQGMNTRELPALRVANTGIPNHRSWPTKFPEAEARLQAAKGAVAKVAAELNIPLENLLTPDYLRAFCFEPIGLATSDIATQLGSLGARPWQVEALAAEISQRLANGQLGQTPDA